MFKCYSKKPKEKNLNYEWTQPKCFLLLICPTRAKMESLDYQKDGINDKDGNAIPCDNAKIYMQKNVAWIMFFHIQYVKFHELLCFLLNFYFHVHKLILLHQTLKATTYVFALNWENSLRMMKFMLLLLNKHDYKVGCNLLA